MLFWPLDRFSGARCRRCNTINGLIDMVWPIDSFRKLVGLSRPFKRSTQERISFEKFARFEEEHPTSPQHYSESTEGNFFN